MFDAGVAHAELVNAGVAERHRSVAVVYEHLEVALVPEAGTIVAPVEIPITGCSEFLC